MISVKGCICVIYLVMVHVYIKEIIPHTWTLLLILKVELFVQVWFQWNMLMILTTCILKLWSHSYFASLLRVFICLPPRKIGFSCLLLKTSWVLFIFPKDLRVLRLGGYYKFNIHVYMWISSVDVRIVKHAVHCTHMLR